MASWNSVRLTAGCPTQLPDTEGVMHRRKFCLTAAGVLAIRPLSGKSPSVTLPVKAKERRKYYRGPAGGDLALVRHSEGIFYRWPDGTELYGGSPVVDGEPAPLRRLHYRNDQKGRFYEVDLRNKLAYLREKYKPYRVTFGRPPKDWEFDRKTVNGVVCYGKPVIGHEARPGGPVPMDVTGVAWISEAHNFLVRMEYEVHKPKLWSKEVIERYDIEVGVDPPREILDDVLTFTFIEDITDAPPFVRDPY